MLLKTLMSDKNEEEYEEDPFNSSMLKNNLLQIL